MFKWCKTRYGMIGAILLLSLSFLSYGNSNSIGWEPPVNSFICGTDKNGDGKWTSKGEAEVCIEGSTFSPEKSYLFGDGYVSNPISHSCPINKVSCNKEFALFCPFTNERCTEGSSSCSRNLACESFNQSYKQYKSCNTLNRDKKRLCAQVERSAPNGSGIQLGAQCPLTGLVIWDDGESDFMSVCNGACSESTQVYQCPLSGSEFESREFCADDCWEWQTRVKYRCPNSGVEYSDNSSCQSNCLETKACDSIKEFKCPLGDDLACVNEDKTNNTDQFSCSRLPCGSYASNNEKSPVDRDVYINDGNYSEEGECLGTVMIFSGRAMDCRKPGLSSAYQDCCSKDDGEVYYDSMGSLIETYGYMRTISTVYSAAAVAYNAYEAGATASEAATAATDFMAGSFDPTTLAISVAIMMVINYLEKACPPEDIETAILDSSGHCVDIGQKCTKKWFGSCVQEVEVKCCFDSKLSRLIHEKGRVQLGMSFGTPETPNCRGFSAEEFQSLDFSKIDLSEYYDDLRYKQQSEVQDGLQETISNKIDG